MMADPVEAIQKEDAFQIESQYTCAAVNTSKALHEWWNSPLQIKNSFHGFAMFLLYTSKRVFLASTRVQF